MELKFRIWDIETKQFFYWDITQNPPTCLTKEYIRENTELFTGRKSIDHIDIYVGDIAPVKFGSAGCGITKDCNCEVILENGIFGLIDNVKENFTPNIINTKIIGNIHQNPELFNQKEN